MSSFEVIWRWATLLLAEILNVSASVAETLLRSQPRWLAHLRLMEENLRQGGRAPDGGAPAEAAGEGETSDVQATRQVLESYAILNRALRNFEARGLALDEGLTERMTRDWSPASIVAYLRTCEAQLKQNIAEALDEAAAVLGPAAAGRDRPGGAIGTAPGQARPAARRRNIRAL